MPKMPRKQDTAAQEREVTTTADRLADELAESGLDEYAQAEALAMAEAVMDELGCS